MTGLPMATHCPVCQSRITYDEMGNIECHEPNCGAKFYIRPLIPLTKEAEGL